MATKKEKEHSYRTSIVICYILSGLTTVIEALHHEILISIFSFGILVLLYTLLGD